MERLPILIISEDAALKADFAEAMKGRETVSLLTAGEARERIQGGEYGAVVLDWEGSDDPARDIKVLSSKGVEPPLVVLVGEGAMAEAAQAMSLGAFDYILKPLDPARAAGVVYKAVEAGGLLSQVLLLKPRIMGMDEGSRPIAVLRDMARRDSPVLIRGESGTGVDLFARALHFNSPRRDGPFVTVDCSSLPQHLLESELFGYQKGAVAGGMVRKSGQTELAEGGTLFLEGIGSMNLHTQQRLQKAMAEKTLDLGDGAAAPWDCRLVFATESNVEDLIRNRMFREDLYRNLSAVSVYMPPLRERKEDIPDLVNFYLEKFRRMHKRGPIVFSETILRRLSENPWPGNLSELQKTIERYVVAGTMPQAQHTPTVEEVTGIHPVRDHAKPPPKPNPLRDASRAAERDAIISTLKECSGNKRMAARTLHISYKTLFNKLHQYNIVTRRDFE